MSEKVTFKELIESIAEETDNSKQFTHDFLKDFVNVINDGLQEDRKVNIAGFGKFNLQRVDEREGYNPQTEEKITIPAHNKIVFKPYKDLRELVNAPYAHLESELIEDKDESSSEDTEPTEEKSGEEDFIPTGPPTQESEGGTEEAPFDLEDEFEEQTSDFEPEDSTESEEDEGDIVEFDSQFEFDDEQEGDKSDNKFDINDYITSADEPEEEKEEAAETIDMQPADDEEEQAVFEDEQETASSDENSVVEETLHHTSDLIDESEDLLDSIDEEERKKDEEENTKQEPIEQLESEEEQPVSDKDKFAPDELKDSEEEKTEEDPTPSFATDRHRKSRTSSMSYIVAAGIVLLIVAGGAWYFGVLSDNGGQQMASEGTETASTTQVTSTQNTQPVQSNEAENQQQAENNGQKSQQDQSSSQKSATATAKAETEASATDRDSESMAIQKGQTLWSIAEDKYGNPRLWPWIYGKNGKLTDPDVIYAGSSLSIPLPSGPQNTLNSTDSVGVAKGFIATYQWYKGKSQSKAKDHIWAAKLYHNNIENLADRPIDKSDLAYANSAR